MVAQKLRCLFRKHRWHNGWDEEAHRPLWTCKRCGLVKTEIDNMPDAFGGFSGGSAGL